MSNVYNLDTLRGELERIYAPVKLQLAEGAEPVVLKALIRLGSKDRDEVYRLINGLEDGEGAESEADALARQFETIVSILTIVSGGGKALAKALGDDLALAVHVFELWMKATQPGEAQPSPA